MFKWYHEFRSSEHQYYKYWRMYYEKRLINAIIVGAILGVFCIIGVYTRSGNTASIGELFSL